jgi:transposase
MKVHFPICAGIDVHKAVITVCLIWRNALGERCQEKRTYSTMTNALLTMQAWLLEHDCHVVAMESTGSYWKPIYNLLEEGTFEIYLVNPSHLKRAPGRKTDLKDCEWLAECLEAGKVEGSFIPPQEIRDVRDLTRYRRRLIQERTAEANRLQKVLETANIKLSSVATDILGVSGRAILQGLLTGTDDPGTLAELAKGRLRAKRAELEEAVVGRLRSHHQLLLTQILGHIDYLDQAIATCDEEVGKLLAPFTRLILLLDTVPGIDKRAAQDIVAEIGVDMSHFPSHKHLCSWAAICAGNNESGGKRLSGKTRKGNPWLRAILVECAQAAAKKNGSYLQALYRRLAPKKGAKRAAVAVAHSILESIYFILRDGVEYQEPEALMAPRKKEQLTRHHVARLEALGYTVELREAAVAA